MKISSRSNEDAVTIADLEGRIESLATYVINQDMEQMRQAQRIVNLELIIAKMQHQLQGQTSYTQGPSNLTPITISSKNGQLTISTKP